MFRLVRAITRYFIRFGIGWLVILAISCTRDIKYQPQPRSDLDAPLCTDSFSPKAANVRIVGFYPSWREDDLPPDSIRWAYLTRLVYAFASVSTDGTLNVTDLDKTDQLVALAHRNGVEVYLSVGGAEYSENFPVMAVNPEYRSNFVRWVKNYLFGHCMDGVDIDWETWTGANSNTVIPEESNALVSLLAELHRELNPFNIGISIDLYATDWGGKHYFDEVTMYAGQLQVMAYDFTGGWSDPGPHASYEDAIGKGSDITATGLAYWENYRGWPTEQILLGVPFYGRDFSNGGAGIPYKNIVALYPAAPWVDRVDDIYYNGLETIRRKALYVKEHGEAGIMIWEIGQDMRDTTSLLKVIGEIFLQ